MTKAPPQNCSQGQSHRTLPVSPILHIIFEGQKVEQKLEEQHNGGNYRQKLITAARKLIRVAT